MAAPPPKKSSNFTTIIIMVAVIFILFNESYRNALGSLVGVVLNPVLGFGGQYPVLTVMLGGSILVAGSTLVRHFTTDWLETARVQAYSRHFQKEMMKARKENNTYRLKQLNEYQPKLMAMSQKTQAATMKSMPLNMLIAVPLFAWMQHWLEKLDYVYFAAPWNPSVTMFGTDGIIPWFGHETSVLPHWILLYGALSIPLGALISKGLKYWSWRERWQKRHPGVTE